jgi:phage terminase large subunit-like protein
MARRRRGVRVHPGQPPRDHTDEAAEGQGYFYDPDAADRVVSFFKLFLRHSKGRWAGKPFALEAWQDHYIRRLYGWKRPDGTRRYRESYLEIPKKNGKTTTAAGQSLYHLVGDREPGAEVYLAACDRQQAGIAYHEAAAMVKASPSLQRVLSLVPSLKRMEHPAENGQLAALSADAYRQEGINSSFINIDELHAHQSRDMYDTLRYAGIARDQPLLSSITTAGYDRQSLCYQVRTYAEKVIGGTVVDPEFLAIIYAAEPKDDIEDPRVWRKANPSLGVTFSEADFRKDLLRAMETPGALAAFKRYRLNLWTGAETAWIEREKWDACGVPAIDPAEFDGCEGHGGLDLADTKDLAAFVELIGSAETGYVTIPHFWVPADRAVERSRRDRVPYLEWAAAGLVTLTPGSSVDYDQVEADIIAIHQRRPIRRLYSDRWNATQTAQHLIEAGIPVVMYGQWFASMNAPMKELERLILRRLMLHGGHPVLSWCADNVVADQDSAGNVKPSKGKSREKIDGITALLNALASAMTPVEPEPAPSVYETRGIQTLEDDPPQ